MAVIRTFSHSQGVQLSLQQHDVKWSEYRNSNDTGTAELYQRVQPGTAPSTASSHVVVSCSDEQVASKADIHVGDLVYFTNERMVGNLNIFLVRKNAPFGPFTYVQDAALKLAQWQRSKPNKAAEFKGHLEEFATSQGFSVEAFHQWQHVMFAKDRRDFMAHPLKTRAEDLSFLKGLLGDSQSCISGYKEAVEALIKVAESKGLC